jgi:hypothetical protein
MSRSACWILVLLALVLGACGRIPRTSGPLPQEAYVWQRQWTPSVREAAGRASGLSRLVALGAEVDFRREPVRVARVPLDLALGAAGRPVGAALRIHTFPGRFTDSPEAVRLVARLAAGLAAEARRQGLALAEIQLDYDCPESRLDDYPALIAAVREAVRPVPVTITALPSWLRRERAFERVIAAADGYVLQVHFLDPIAGAGDPLVLCDPAAARRAVERAARFRRPFRVALPTYGYQVVFRADGRRAGVAAEGPPVLPPSGGTVRTVRSDPSAMAGLVRDWTADRPAALAGILWYRLPSAGDRLNWPWPTFEAVRAGRMPRAEVAAEARSPAPGLIEIDLVNRGEAEVPWPALLRVGWKDLRMIAADGLSGYRIGLDGPDGARVEQRDSPEDPSRPGDRRTIAWLRFDGAPTAKEIRLETLASLARPDRLPRSVPPGWSPPLGLRPVHP